MTRILIEAIVLPTEDKDKVAQALNNIFPEIGLYKGQTKISGEGTDLNMFIELLTKQKIRDSARDILLDNRQEDTTIFFLNKQTAFASRISFSQEGEGTLGEIRVELTLDENGWVKLVKTLSPPVYRDALIKK
jgi:predicted RNA binding protein with dsRBD fold (UPF0201 family)